MVARADFRGLRSPYNRRGSDRRIDGEHMAKKRPPRRRSAHLITRSELAPVGIAGAKSAVKPDAPLWLLTAVIRRRGREKMTPST
jgi:hypothetical protein